MVCHLYFFACHKHAVDNFYNLDFKNSQLKYSQPFNMKNLNKYLIHHSNSIQNTLEHLNALPKELTIFVIDDEEKVIGSVTDGDIRRGLIKKAHIEDSILTIANRNFHHLEANNIQISTLKSLREKHINFIPILDKDQHLVDVLNFEIQHSKLPLDAVIMAGGKGSRLMPLTKDTPKPLLKIGGKPIIEYNVDRLSSFGVKNLKISIRYLGQQLMDYFGDGSDRDINICYVTEDTPLGTAGALTLIPEFKQDYILMMNSDLLTNINYETMFEQLLNQEGDMIVATIPYEVQVPYGIFEIDNKKVVALKEKPTYTYYSNAGIYIFKREIINLIPEGEFFDATDFMEKVIAENKTLLHYPIIGYWLDIGNPNDFKKAKEDVAHIKF